MPESSTSLKRSSYHNVLERRPDGTYEISDRVAPPLSVRKEFEARRTKLVTAMTTTDALDIAELVLEMFKSFPMVKLERDKAKSVVREYVEIIGNLPLWAIIAGRNECVSRETPFPPSPGELRGAAARAAASFQDELAELNHILNAKVYTEISAEERNRVREKMRNWANDLKRNNGFEPPRRARDGRDMIPKPLEDGIESKYQGPVSLSPALREKLREDGMIEAERDWSDDETDADRAASKFFGETLR